MVIAMVFVAVPALVTRAEPPSHRATEDAGMERLKQLCLTDAEFRASAADTCAPYMLGMEEAARTQTQAGPQPSPQPGASAHEDKRAEIRAAIEKCASQGADTVGQCATDRANGMMGTLLDGADAFAQATTATACQSAFDAAGAANSALLGIKTNCAMSYQTCSNSCREADSLINKFPVESERSGFRSELSSGKTQCQSAQSRLRGIEQNIAQMQASQTRAQTCLSDVGTPTAPTGQLALQAHCAQYPYDPACAQLRQDCSNPQYAQNNPICICATNPGDSRCGNTGRGLEASIPTTLPPAGGGGGGIDGALGNPNALNSTLNDAALNGPQGPFESTTGANPRFSNSPASHGGGSSSLAGDPGAPGGPAGPGRSTFDTNVLGGGGAPRGPGGSGPGGSAGSGQPVDRGTRTALGWIPPKIPSEGDAVNLERFRPKMDGLPGRGPTSQLSSLGILGPHVNIWKQMNRRYLSLSNTLMP